MQKNPIILICLLAMVLGCFGDDSMDADEFIPAAGEEDFIASEFAPDLKIWVAWNRPYADADKSGVDDSQMCWAAVVSNLLTWSGWALDEDDTFAVFRSQFQNKPGYLYDALRYYFTENVPGVGAEMVTVREVRSARLMDFIFSALHKGKGLAIKLMPADREIGHFLTLYGYGSSGLDGDLTLFYTDSDDYRRRMREMRVMWNDAADRWDIQGRYAGWKIDYAVSLAGP